MAVAQEDMETFRDRTLGRRLGEDTFRQYEMWIRRFEMWLGEEEPTLGTLIDFDAHLADEDRPDYLWENETGRPAPQSYSYSSRTLALSALKLWLRLHYDEDVGEEVQHIVSGEPDDFDPKYISRDDVDEVLAAASEDCNVDGCYAALKVSYDAILRAKEFTRIRREDIDFDNGTLYVRAVKGSRNSELSLQSDTLDALKEHVDAYPDREYPFWNSYDRKWKPGAWSTHFLRQHHEVGSHSWGRHTPIVHRLSNPDEFEDMEADEGVFGQVYRRARHQNPGQTADYARLVGGEVPDWAGGE